MLMPHTTSDRQPDHEDDQQHCEELAARLRQEHQGWIIIWLAAHHEFRAYRRLPGARRDITLSAATDSDLAAQISRAEQAARVVPPPPERSRLRRPPAG
jgi:hypothetical protein